MVFQFLYSYDFSKFEKADIISLIMNQLKVTKKVALEAYAFVEKIVPHLNELDECIAKFSPDYKLSRIGKVELNVLRLGIYELLYEKEVPPKVVVSEAIRLAKKFATSSSGNFVNAVLDAFYKGHYGSGLKN